MDVSVMIGLGVIALVYGLWAAWHYKESNKLINADDTLMMTQPSAGRLQPRQPAQPIATYTYTPSAIPATRTEPYAPQSVDQPNVWSLSYLLKLQAQAVHVLIVGPTNAGKTTLARAIIATRLRTGEQIIILDPHKSADDWVGLTCYGAGQNYTEIDQQLAFYVELMKERYQQRATISGYNPAAITIVIDEWPAIKASCENASEFIKQMSREARKINIRLVIPTQSDRVETLGIKGEGDTKENFSMAYVGAKAANLWSKDVQKPIHGIVWKDAGADDLVMIDGYISGAQLDQFDTTIQAYGEPSVKPNTGDSVKRLGHQTSQAPSSEYGETWAQYGANQSLLESLIHGQEEPLPSADDHIKTQQTIAQEVIPSETVPSQEVAAEAQEAQEVPLPADDLSIAIRGLIHMGFSKNKTIDLLAAKMPGKNALKYQVIKYALGEISENPLQDTDG